MSENGLIIMCEVSGGLPSWEQHLQMLFGADLR